MRSAAIAIVRNAADIAPLTVLHHWLLGCERVWVIDNGSTDGTHEALKRIAARIPGIRVDRDDGPFDQAGWTSDMASTLSREGFGLIVPFDSDECWNFSVPSILRCMRRRKVNVVCAPVINYVQSRDVRHAGPGLWRHARRRVDRPYNPDLHAARVIGNGRVAFVERAFPRKVVFAPPPGTRVRVVKGNHRVVFDGARVANRRNFTCLHLPLRAASELEKRVVDYRMRHKPFRLEAGAGWRLDYWAEMLASGSIEREWAANSYDAAGMLDVFGVRRPTILDATLVRHLARAQRFLDTLDLFPAPFWAGMLRPVFKARPVRFKAPENIEGFPAA